MRADKQGISCSAGMCMFGFVNMDEREFQHCSGARSGTCQARQDEGPRQVRVQRQHRVVHEPVVRRHVSVHHVQLAPQIVPVSLQRHLLIQQLRKQISSLDTGVMLRLNMNRIMKACQARIQRCHNAT